MSSHPPLSLSTPSDTLPPTLPPHWRLESFPWASVKCCVLPGRPCSPRVPMVCSNVCRSDRRSDLGWQGFYVVCLCDFRHKDNINSLLYSFVAWLKLMFLLYVLYRSLLHALSLWGKNMLFYWSFHCKEHELIISTSPVIVMLLWNTHLPITPQVGLVEKRKQFLQERHQRVITASLGGLLTWLVSPHCSPAPPKPVFGGQEWDHKL